MVAHQIFYGRHSVSIEFFVDENGMVDPNRQYLTMMEGLKRQILDEMTTVNWVPAMPLEVCSHEQTGAHR